jgi:predicted RNase H-like nuclease (RuvC/YqgF family)
MIPYGGRGGLSLFPPKIRYNLEQASNTYRNTNLHPMDITNVIIPAITGLLTFFLGQQRGKKEIESISLQNLEKSVQIYQTIIQDLKEEITSLNKKVDELQGKVDEMMKENHELKKTLSKKTFTSKAQ